MKKWVSIGMVASVVSLGAWMAAQAEEPAPAPAPAGEVKPAKEGKHREHAAADLKEMVVEGKITKHTAEAKGDKGAAASGYILTDAQGNVVRLPKSVAKEGQPAINLDEYVDATVKVTFKGFEREKDGKKKVMAKELLKVEKI